MHGTVRLVVPAALLLLAGTGCSRKHFRERADADVTGIITQKNVFPEWAVKNWFVYPHPESRFAHPFNPDRPPYPADDYAARLLSPNPQHPTKKTGTGRYDGEGYMRLLAEWDAENRAGDPARGAPPGPPERLFLPAPPHLARGKAGAASTRPPAAPVASGAWESARPALTPAGGVPTGAEAAAEAKRGPRGGAGWEPAAPAGAAGSHDPAVVPASAVGTRKPVPVIAVTPVLPPPVVQPDRAVLQPVSAAKPPPPADASADLPPDNPPLPPGELPAIPQPPEKLPAPGPADPKAGGPKPPAEFPSTETLLTTGSGIDDYLRALASNQQGFRIKMQQAVELGLINSREFQDRREDLYLTALPVTLERFSFAAQAFFTEQVVRDFLGSDVGDRRLWSAETTGGFGKRFATGGTLLVQLANQIVINLGQGRPDIAFSNFALSFTQPLFRGGGFAVTLEDLTAAERNLLYGMRSYARFRKLFYVSLVAGGGITNNPYGLQGLAPNLGRGIGGNLTAPVVGYLPLLQQSAVIANQRQNVDALAGLLRQYQEFSDAGQIAPLQVGQVEVNLLNSRGQLLGSGTGGGGGSGIRGYLDQLDNFKLQLGLPVTVGLDLEDSPLRPIREQLARFEDIYADKRVLENQARQFDPATPIDQYRARWRRLLNESDLVKGTAFARGIGSRWDAWAKLNPDQITAREDDLTRQRRALLDRQAERRAKNLPDLEADAARLAEIKTELELAGFERAVRAYEAQPWAKLKEPEASGVQAGAFQRMSALFFLVALGGANERLAETGRKWPKLPSLPVNGADVLAVDLDEAYTAGIQAALSSRLDLMNARGQVVDAYRRIAVQANSLQGVLDVGYDVTAATPGTVSQPLNFSGSRSRQTLTLRGELPLVRRAERNNYRAALIGYQRQRRTLMAFEDNIANDVRGDIRQLRTLAELYKIQQRVVELGYSQVDNARETQFQPLEFGRVLDPGSSAALTQQVLDAQNRLLQAQNQLYALWVNYLTARMQLYLDLELMQIDERGVWCDEQTPGTDDLPRPGSGPQPAERLPAPTPVGPADRK